MANSVGRIYNATLGDSQLQSDGEHTLFTTNSSTTQILKEIRFDLGAGVQLTDAYIEVNGHNVASISASGATLAGEIIVPPNSTVKIKAPSTYPVAFFKEYEMTVSDSPHYLYVNTQVRDQTSGTVTTSLTQNKSNGATSSSNAQQYIDIVDARGFARRVPGSGSSLYQPFYWMSAIYHDSNSVQKINRHPGQDYGEGHSGSYPITIETGANGSYRGFAFDRDISRSMFTNPLSASNGGPEPVLNTIDQHSNTFQVRGSLNYGENSPQNFTKWNGVAGSSPATSQGNFSPSLTSSWPRAHCIGDWYFWIPHSGYGNNVYGVSLKTGQMFNFNGMSNWNTSGSTDFTVSIDTANDKLVFWRPTGATSIVRSTSSDTITALESATPGGVPGKGVTNHTVSFAGGNYATNNFGSCQLSDRMDGGFCYKNSGGDLVSCDYDGNALYSHSTFAGIDNITPYQNGLWKRTMGKMTAAEISSAGISQPTFEISVFGYTAS